MVYKEGESLVAFRGLALSQEPRLKSHATQRVRQTSKKLNQTIQQNATNSLAAGYNSNVIICERDITAEDIKSYLPSVNAPDTYLNIKMIEETEIDQDGDSVGSKLDTTRQ